MSEEPEQNQPVEQDPIYAEATVTMSDKWNQKINDQHAKYLEELCPKSQYEIDVKGEKIIYRRRKIKSGERKVLEALRAQLIIEVRRGSKHSVETEDQIYKKSAQYHLINSKTNAPMTTDEFDGTEFEEIKKILDACSYRTEKPVPPLEE